MDFHPFDSSFSGLDPLFSSPSQPNDLEIDEIIDHFVLGDLSRLEAEAALERLARAKQRILPRLLSMAASPDPGTQP